MITIQEQVQLAGQCRFHVGGPADWFACIPPDVNELEEALGFARERGLRCFVYAGGTNLFFDDAGFRGLVLRIQGGGWSFSGEAGDGGRTVTAGSGYVLARLLRELAAEGFSGGLEFLANIPGSIGGAVVGNAGCYGRAIADVLTGAGVYDTVTGLAKRVGPEFFEYAYRHSKLKYSDRWVVLSADLRVSHGDTGETALRAINAELEERRTKHPHDAWCAGSYFKNPGREHAAWKLITAAGLAGARVGDACLSPVHANFLVNAGQATSAEIIELTRLIQRGVRGHSGHLLTPEVRYVSPEGAVELRPEDA